MHMRGGQNVRRLERLQDLLGFTFLNLILLGIVPNLVSDYVKQNVLVGRVCIAAVVLSYLLLTWMMKLFARRSRRELTLVQRENPAPRKGLIVFMSPGSRVAWQRRTFTVALLRSTSKEMAQKLPRDKFCPGHFGRYADAGCIAINSRALAYWRSIG
jgi:hypothetical protein